VSIAAGIVATADEGEGGVCVALTCFTLVVEGLLEPNNLLKPKCIEHADSSNVNKIAKDITVIFFIFASKQCG
jgi:hypothetical protein